MITINGQAIAGSTIETGIFRMSTAERTMNGRMVMDIIAIKRQHTLKWEVISAPDLKTILDILESAVFHTLDYPDPQSMTGQRTITVYTGDIKMGNFFTDRAGIRQWTDVTIGLVEQ